MSLDSSQCSGRAQLKLCPVAFAHCGREEKHTMEQKDLFKYDHKSQLNQRAHGDKQRRRECSKKITRCVSRYEAGMRAEGSIKTLQLLGEAVPCT